MDGTAADSTGYESDRTTSEDSELQVVAVDSRLLQRIFHKFALSFEPQRVGHFLFNVIDGALQSAQGALPRWVNAADIHGLVEAADDLVHDVFETKIGD